MRRFPRSAAIGLTVLGVLGISAVSAPEDNQGGPRAGSTLTRFRSRSSWALATARRGLGEAG